MKWHPIFFSGPMVRALLAGRKTQTRRIIRPQPRGDHGIQRMFGMSPDKVAFGEPGLWREVGADYPDGEDDDRRCPYGHVGDRLWVRETIRIIDERQLYDADRKMALWNDLHVTAREVSRWSRHQLDTNKSFIPSIHMPRWASRIALEITGMRAERLLDITDADAIAEGLSKITKDDGRTWKYGIPDRDGYPGTDDDGWPWDRWSVSPRTAYLELWNDINGTRDGGIYRSGWNPWVWVLDFKRVVDARAAA